MQHGLWSKSAVTLNMTADNPVASMAIGQDGHIFLTGPGNPLAGLGCAIPDAGGAMGGYLAELDDTGACVWGYLFGPTAEGTGVAVDGTGNVALTGKFTGSLTIAPKMPMTASSDGLVRRLCSARGPRTRSTSVAQIGDMGGATGDQKTTSVAVNGTKVAVSGNYTKSLAVTFPGPNPPAAVPSLGSVDDAHDGFVIWFDVAGTPPGAFSNDVLISSPLSAGTDQLANAVALDASSNLAFVGTTTGPATFDNNAMPSMSMFVTSMFLSSCDSLGHSALATILGGSGVQAGTSVAYDSTGQILVGGTFRSTANLIGADGGTSISDMVMGTGVLVAKYGTPPSPLAALALGLSASTDSATIAGLAPYNDPEGAGASVAFAGGFSGTASFVGGGPSVTTPGATTAIYVAKANGMLSSVLWLEHYGDGVKNQSADAIAVDPRANNGDIVIAGHYQGKVDFGNGVKLDNVSTTNTDELFVVRLSP